MDPELGHWTIRIKSIRVDNQVVKFCEEGCKGVVDTGTSLVAVPTKVFPELFELMRHPAPLSGNCKGSGPQWHIELDDFTITLGPEDYAREDHHPFVRTVPAWPGQEEPEELRDDIRNDVHCKPMLMAMDMPEPIGPKLFILGEPVLRKYYSVYDAEDKRIGFGRAVHTPKQEPVIDHNDDSWFDEAEAELLEQDKKDADKAAKEALDAAKAAKAAKAANPGLQK